MNRLQGPRQGELLNHLPGTQAGQAAYGGSRGTPGTGQGGGLSSHRWELAGHTILGARVRPEHGLRFWKRAPLRGHKGQLGNVGKVGKQCLTMLLLSAGPSLPLTDLSQRGSSESGPSVDLPYLVALLSSHGLGYSSSAGRKERETSTHMGSDLSHFRSLVATFMEPSTGYAFRPRFDRRSSVQPARVSLGRLLNSPAG